MSILVPLSVAPHESVNKIENFPILRIVFSNIKIPRGTLDPLVLATPVAIASLTLHKLLGYM